MIFLLKTNSSVFKQRSSKKRPKNYSLFFFCFNPFFNFLSALNILQIYLFFSRGVFFLNPWEFASGSVSGVDDLFSKRVLFEWLRDR